MALNKNQDPIDFDKIREDLADHKSPIVRKNKNSKKISVEYYFDDIGNIKIITFPEEWFEWWENFEQVGLETLESRISRPSKKKLEALEAYSKEYPDLFESDLFTIIKQANLQTLRCGNRKARGYNMTAFDLVRIKLASMELYIYLDENFDKPHDKQPIRIDRLFKAYGIDDSDLEDPYEIETERRLKLIRATMLIIKERFQHKIVSPLEDSVSEEESFYKHYICYTHPPQKRTDDSASENAPSKKKEKNDSPLARLRKMQSIKSGRSPLLQEIFSRLS